MPDTLSQLEDVDVLTVGLVDAGANAEDFFLLKHAPAEDNEEPNNDAHTIGVSDGFWARLKRTVTDALAADPSNDNGTEVKDMTKNENHEGKELEPDVAKGQAPAPDTADPPDKSPEPATTQIDKATPTNTHNDELLTRMAALEKSRDDLLIEVRKAKAMLDDERGKSELRKAVEDASGYQSLAISPDDLGEQLHWLRKTAPERAEYWEGLLKASDNALATASVFAEYGTSQEPVLDGPAGEVAKAVDEAEDPKEALLSLDPKTAAEYLRERRKELREA